MYIDCKYSDCVIDRLSNFAYFYVCKLVFTTRVLTIHQASSRDSRSLIERTKDSSLWPRVSATERCHICNCKAAHSRAQRSLRQFSSTSQFRVGKYFVRRYSKKQHKEQSDLSYLWLPPKTERLTIIIIIVTKRKCRKP